MASVNRLGVEYAPGKFGPLTGPLAGGSGSLVLAGLGRVVPGFPMWAPLALGVTGIAAAIVISAHRLQQKHHQPKQVKKELYFVSSCWFAAAVWCTLTIIFGWSVAGFVIWLLAMAASGLLSPLVAKEAPKPGQAIAGDIVPAGTGSDFGYYLRWKIAERLNLRHGWPAVDKVKDWKLVTNSTGQLEPAGSTWLVTAAPGTKLTVPMLAGIADDLESILQLPHGCVIQARPGGPEHHQGQTMLDVTRINWMKDAIEFPRQYAPRSVRQEIALGEQLYGDPLLAEFHQASWVINGQREGGKTVLLQGTVGWNVQCTDSLVWYADLNAGGAPAFWTGAYARGEVSSPVIDWVGMNAQEVLYMAEVAVSLAHYRKQAYQSMMLIHGVDVLPIGNGVDICSLCHMAHPPQINFYVDEGGETMGEDATAAARQATAKLMEVQRIARAMCINIIFTVQRAVAEYLPTQMKEACAVKISTRVGKDSELAYLFDWGKNLASADLVYSGQMFAQSRSGPVLLFKGYLLRPPQINELAIVAAPWRPQLPQAEVEVGGDLYAGRWTRPDIQDYLARLRGQINIPVKVSAASAQQLGSEILPPSMARPADAIAGMESVVGQMRNAAKAEPAVPPVKPLREQVGSMPAGEVDDVLDSIAGLGVFDPGQPGERFTGAPHEPSQDNIPAPTAEGPPTESAKTKAARHAFLVHQLHTAGRAGLKLEELIRRAREHGFIHKRRQTISDDLKELLEAKAVVSLGDGMWQHSDYAA